VEGSFEHSNEPSGSILNFGQETDMFTELSLGPQG
jgi:hypothetical protein